MARDWVEAEFEAIFREHYLPSMRAIRRVLRSDAEAEEVCAETFMRLYRSGPGIAEGGHAAGWLYRTATRAAIDRLRAHKRRGFEVAADPDACLSLAGPEESPLTQLLRGEKIAEVRRVLARLSVEKAQMLLLRHSGLSYGEIAEAMQVNPTSVGTMLARAEAEFAAKLKQSQQQVRKSLWWKAQREGQ